MPINKKRGILPKWYSILIALDESEEKNIKAYNRTIINKLREYIITHWLNKKINILDNPGWIKLKSGEEAIKYRKQKEIDIIIRWKFTENLKENGEIINDLKINFTYHHKTDKEGKTAVSVATRIMGSLAQKKHWRVVDGESKRDVEIISSSIIEISQYILWLCLFVAGEIEISIDIFSKLEKKTSDDLIKKEARIFIVHWYKILCVRETSLARKKNDYTKSLEICRKILERDKNDLIGLQMKAYCEYNAWMIPESKATTERMSALNPNHPNTLINKWFLSIIHWDYKKAIVTYKELIKQDNVEKYTHIWDVLEFLDIEYKKTWEIGIKFASWLIRLFFHDRELGIEDMQFFMNKTRHNQIYRKFRNFVEQKLIKKKKFPIAL